MFTGGYRFYNTQIYMVNVGDGKTLVRGGPLNHRHGYQGTIPRSQVPSLVLVRLLELVMKKGLGP
jgi:hypothetical protein